MSSKRECAELGILKRKTLYFASSLHQHTQVARSGRPTALFNPRDALPRGMLVIETLFLEISFAFLALCYVFLYEVCSPPCEAPCLARLYCISCDSLSLVPQGSHFIMLGVDLLPTHPTLASEFQWTQISKPPWTWLHFQSTFKSIIRTCSVAGSRKPFLRKVRYLSRDIFLGCFLG